MRSAMNKNIIKYIIIGVLLFACGWYFFYDRPVPETEDKLVPLSVPHQTNLPPIKSSQPADQPETPSYEKKAEDTMYHPKDIQEIKKQIYDLNIEYVEDIPRLDRVVQTGNSPTRDFWQGNWMSVDDNKQDLNGFFLRPQKDGTFVFFPDEKTTRTYTFFETPKTYTYDAAKREFYWEIDYYGKTISHRARFINDNVLAMMLISGNKVTLDLYAKGPADNK
jgi:hypothetical protein